MSGELERLLAEPGTQRCLRFLSGESHDMSDLICCYADGDCPPPDAPPATSKPARPLDQGKVKKMACKGNCAAGLERRLAGVEAELRETRHRDGEKAVDAAIDEGRLPREEREDWIKAFAASPEVVGRWVAALPANRELAYANANSTWSDEDEEQYRRYFVATFGREVD